ncbi:MAG: ABC-2 family transporter protein [Firmicutes bacterium]|nr:ABC-2 family transporter protein [Bacillota bacterium]
MTSPRDYIRVFLCDCKLKLARAMEFRFDFICGCIFSFAVALVNIVFQFLIYSNTRGYPGWSFGQILLFQAVILLVAGVRDTVFGNVRLVFEENVQFGNVDRLLLFPFPSLGMVLVRGFQFNALSSIPAGLITLGYSIWKLQLRLQWWHIGLFLLFIVIGMLLYVSFIILHCSLALRLIYVRYLRDVFDRIVNFGYYPAEIFSRLIKIIYLTVIPVAVFIYFPSQALLGRLNLICASGAGISVALFAASIKIWNHQLKNYTGAGG